jgi:D-alanyl-D-alanine carboxypeptidase/D-alanyl-D-alanine-endopeptidase (penicillin-binding protein 4)
VTRRVIAFACAILALAGCQARAADRSGAAAPAPTQSPIPQPLPTPTTATTHRPPVDRAPRLRTRSAPWAGALDDVVGAAPASVSVAIGDRLVYSHLGRVPRIPASNEKLLLSMVLLDRFGPSSRIPTTVEARRVRHDVVRGDVWLVGHGDPEVDGGTLERLAAELRRGGIRRIGGSVVGDTSTFRRERRAPGWHRIALSYVSIPTALVFDANADASGFVFDPEREAATALERDLLAEGVAVSGDPRAGAVPDAARPIARVRSAPLVEILRRENTSSINLDAEVLGKRLGASVEGGRGSIAKGARAIEAWARSRGVRLVAHDACGLSYANRVSTDAMVRLLAYASTRRWGEALRSTLPSPGTGTLGDRLLGLDVRAKTGTLIDGVSALSGWVRAADGRRAAFSILSEGMSKDAAVALEDAVVRFLAERA